LPKCISLGVALYGFKSSGKFIDIGIPEDYFRAQNILKD
jgi:NDP-sugar pyrophosphorylase family protein